MKKLTSWDDFNLLEYVADVYKYTSGQCWWGVPHGNDDTGGFTFTLTPLSSPVPEKGVPANVSTMDYDDTDGDCDQFDEGTPEHDECIELAAEKWEKSCHSKLFDRIYFYMIYSTISVNPHQKGGHIYSEYNPPLPQTVSGFIKETEERGDFFVAIASVKTERMKNFITKHFFGSEVYKNPDAPNILKNLDNLINGEDVGLNLLLDQLKELVDNGTMLDYDLILKIFKESIPRYDIRMTARGVDVERLIKLGRGYQLLKRNK